MYEATTQFDGAERIATKYGITREAADELGFKSQARAATAWAEDRFAGQIAPIEVTEYDENGTADGTDVRSRRVSAADHPSRRLAGLRTNTPGGIHTAATSSQICDGAAALLLASPEGAESLGLKPRARIVDSVLAGCDPVLMLEGPIPATGCCSSAPV